MYAFFIIGGYLGDKVLGLRRTYFLGIIFLMVGYGSFGIVNSVHMLYWAMGMVLVGLMLMKPLLGIISSRELVRWCDCWVFSCSWDYMEWTILRQMALLLT